VRRRHGVIVERNAAGSFGSRLRRVTHDVHRCDAVFGTNWCRAIKVQARRSTVACVIPNLLRSTRPRRAKNSRHCSEVLLQDAD
jgi:hypothetical protein